MLSVRLESRFDGEGKAKQIDLWKQDHVSEAIEACRTAEARVRMIAPDVVETAVEQCGIAGSEVWEASMETDGFEDALEELDLAIGVVQVIAREQLM